MDLDEFKEKMLKYVNMINIELDEKQLCQFYTYMRLMQDWNEKVNLTAITEPEEIILKHFIDSMTILEFIKETDKVVDIGTGAGFPGIPVKIAKPRTEVVLLDSLNKRINFLNETVKNLNLLNTVTIHSRAEDFGSNNNYREKFDIATSRAVAPMNILLEYLMPTIKVGGLCICMKGPEIEDEIKNSENAIRILGGQIEKVEKITLPDSDNGRSLILVRKVKTTPNKYPRKTGVPSKTPI